MQEVFVTHMQPFAKGLLRCAVGIDGINRLQQRFPAAGTGQLPIGLLSLIFIRDPVAGMHCRGCQQVFPLFFGNQCRKPGHGGGVLDRNHELAAALPGGFQHKILLPHLIDHMFLHFLHPAHAMDTVDDQFVHLKHWKNLLLTKFIYSDMISFF